MTPQKLAVLNGVFFSVGYMLAFLAPLVAGALRDATGSFVPGFAAFSVFAFSLLFGGMMLKDAAQPAKQEQGPAACAICDTEVPAQAGMAELAHAADPRVSRPTS